MNRFVRLAGIGLVVVLFVLAIGGFTVTLRAAPKTGAVAVEPTKATPVTSVDSGVVNAVEPFATNGPIPDHPTQRQLFGTGSHWVIGNLDFNATGIDDAINWDEVEGAIEPGLYASDFAASECRYEIHRLSPEGIEYVDGSDEVAVGRLLVTLNDVEPDRFTSEPGCGGWVKWRPLPEPLETAYNGDYGQGDLAVGTWLVPQGCYWEEVLSFRGANLFDTVESKYGPTTVEVNEDSLGFRIRLCDFPATRVDDLVG